MLAVLAPEGAYSIEFAVDSQLRRLNIGFWEVKQFVCKPIVHSGTDVSPTKSYIDLLSRMLSAVSGGATIIRCGGSSSFFTKALERNPGRKTGVQYTLTLTSVQFGRLLHKHSFRRKNSYVFHAVFFFITAEWFIVRTPGGIDTVF